jgi:hypothetical protein
MTTTATRDQILHEIQTPNVGSQARPAEPPRTYIEWNDALAASIFRQDMAGREVFLYVNDDLIEELGGTGSVPDFVAAVQEGPPGVSPNVGLCQKALRTFDRWRERELHYPPYIGYLGLFVLAVGLEGDFEAHAYYKRLRTLLDLTPVDAGALPSFDQMLRLWEDLEVWSNRDMEGAVGIFSIRIAGEWIHVGLPKAQAILTEHERKGLSDIFTVAALDPTAPVSDTELARVVRKYGADNLRPATLALLGSRTSEPALFSVLLDAIRRELDDWDGEAPGVDTGYDGGTGGGYAVTATARVCIHVDEIASRASTTLRLAARPAFPEDGLMLESPDELIRLTCHEYLPGWSSPLCDAATNNVLSASAFDWREPPILADRGAGWRVRLPSRRARIFVSGRASDLPGYVEVRRLPLKSPFLLAAQNPIIPALDRWMESGQADLKRIDILEGLPAGWTLFRSDGATQDSAIRQTLPELSLPSAITIRLVGGIRSGMGNTYFKFAPPMIVVEGASGDDIVACNGHTLAQAADNAEAYSLPAHLETGAPITVEVVANGEVVRRQSLFLADRFDWNRTAPLFSSDPSGAVHKHGDLAGDGIAGALITSTSPHGFPVRPTIPSTQRVFLVGRRPGEITNSTTQARPDAWEPIWLVELTRRGRAEYCGLDLACSSPMPDIASSAEDQALWRDVLWHRRKRIEPPAHPRLRALWRDYVEAARVPTR